MHLCHLLSLVVHVLVLYDNEYPRNIVYFYTLSIYLIIRTKCAIIKCFNFVIALNVALVLRGNEVIGR